MTTAKPCRGDPLTQQYTRTHLLDAQLSLLGLQCCFLAARYVFAFLLAITGPWTPILVGSATAHVTVNCSGGYMAGGGVTCPQLRKSRTCTLQAGILLSVMRPPATPISRAATSLPMAADRFGAIWCMRLSTNLMICKAHVAADHTAN